MALTARTPISAAIRRWSRHADSNPATTIVRKADQQLDRDLHWTRNLTGTTVTSDQPGNGNRRHDHLIGLAVPCHVRMKWLAFAGFVGAGVLDRLDRDRKQRMIGFQRHRLVGVRIGAATTLPLRSRMKAPADFSTAATGSTPASVR